MTTPQDRTTKARELYERFPTNDLSRYNYAQAVYDAGDYPAAAEHLAALCAKKPDWMVVHILLGKCRLQTGAREDAKKLFEHALQLARVQHHDGPREELEQLLAGL
jgi:predicted Zn-dependent protease